MDSSSLYYLTQFPHWWMKAKQKMRKQVECLVLTPSPTAPSPKTATVEPFGTLASFQTAPNPVVKPQERKLACGMEILESILTT